jgi:hypothetical protein
VRKVNKVRPICLCMHGTTSWEANWFSASQEIHLILWNPKVHCRIHKCPPPGPLLSQLNPTITSTLLKINLNIILPSMPGSPKWSLSLRFPHQNPVYASSLLCTHYIPCPSHSSIFYNPNNIGWGMQITKLIIMQFSPPVCYLVPLRPKYSPQHPILKYPQPTFLPQCELPSFAPIQNKRQIYKSVYLDLYIFG